MQEQQIMPSLFFTDNVIAIVLSSAFAGLGSLWLWYTNRTKAEKEEKADEIDALSKIITQQATSIADLYEDFRKIREESKQRMDELREEIRELREENKHHKTTIQELQSELAGYRLPKP
jgi:peptidoglycan hydrolase CwlO-like protein